MPDAQPPLVSVIVPAFNAETTLRQSLQSALSGTYENIEIIVVDDGSTDATADSAQQFADAEKRMRVHRQPRGGVAAAFNAGLELAEGDYVARLDADDLWHPAKLDRQMELALRDPDAAFIYSFVRYVDGEGRVLADAPTQRFPRHALCRGIYESLVGGNSSALMRRSAVAAVGGYDPRLASWEDLLLQLRISARHPIAFVPEYLVGYRVRPDSLSADPHNMLGSWRAARGLIEELFPQVPRFVRDWAHARRCIELAESFAWRRDFVTCASLLAEGARHDPKRVAHVLGYRLARHLKRRLSRPAEAAAGPLFTECEPAELFRRDASEGPALLRLEAERQRHLEDLDRSLAQADRRDQVRA